MKRTLLWVIFTFSALMLYDNWQVSSGKPSMFFAKAPAAASTASAANVRNDVPSATATAAAPSGASVSAAPVAPAEKITLTTDVLSAQIDTAGGIITQLDLLKHKEEDGKAVRLFAQDAGHQYLARSGLIGATDLPNHTVVFAVQPGSRELGSNDSVSLVLVAEKNGVKFTKTYTAKRGSYVLDVKFDVQNTGAQAVSPTLYMELARDGSQIDKSKFYSTFTGPAVYTDKDKFQKVEFSDIEKGKAKFNNSEEAGKAAWVGMVQHYFASAWLPQDNAKSDIYLNKVDNNFYRVGVQQTLGSIAPGAQVSTSARLFAGPQEEKNLEAIAPGLDLMKDYGWLALIAKPLFWLLEKLHGVLGNWGWAIIALTVLIKIVFFPLSAAGYKSMGKMKDLQPRMVALKERYKGEPQKLNQAMMEMYKTEKVNPMGGCFPILIQIPVFIALYWVLLSSVEMRNAPWVGWIHNLAAPDPFYILPVIMAVSMFVQTKLNPTPPDPIQAKVMMVMPLVFSVMFFFFPAGLVLYWVVNNILSIAQQWQINRMLGTNKKAA